jgi:hypothetical protein
MRRQILETVQRVHTVSFAAFAEGFLLFDQMLYPNVRTEKRKLLDGWAAARDNGRVLPLPAMLQ